MSEATDTIRWELDALKTEYNQHWNHFRHAIDKSYQAFNIHMVMIALLFSAISLANEQVSSSVSLPLFLAIAFVALAGSEGTISTLVTQRTGYVWHQKVIDTIRERISKKTSNVLDPEVNLFYDRRIFSPGTAWFGRINFVVLTGGAIIVLCAYLFLEGISSIYPELGIISIIALYLALFVFVLTLQKLYHSVISRANTKARNLYCQLQNYENPPKDSRDVKYLRTYSQYLLASEIITVVITIFFVTMNILFLVVLVLYIIMTLLSARCWQKIHKEIQC